MPNLGAPELLIIVLIVILLFGAKKLPDLARSTGRSLRIFKAETKGLMNDEDEDDDVQKPAKPQQIATTQQVVEPQPVDPGQPAKAADPLPPTHTEK